MPIRSFLCTLPFLLAAGCQYDDSGLDRVEYEPVQVPEDVIDTGATFEDFGAGVGMFVEYESGGTWRLTFSCDTQVSQTSCVWTVYAQTLDASSVLGSEGIEFEASDYLASSTEGFIEMQTVTELDLDVVEFRVAEGMAVGFDVWLHGDPNPERYVYWIAEGGVNYGISSPSFDLVPTEP